jgi:hypothetical protein
MSVILRLSIIPVQGTPMMYTWSRLILFSMIWVTMLRESQPLATMADLFFAVGQIIGQVDAAVAVPPQTVSTDRGSLQSRARSSWATVPLRNPMTMSTVQSLSIDRQSL